LTGTRRCEHITPILKELYWLPVAERIDFKVLLNSFGVLNDIAPSYLKEIHPSGTLRSANKGPLIQPKFYLKVIPQYCIVHPYCT